MKNFVASLTFAVLCSACATHETPAESPIRGGSAVAASISLCQTTYDQLYQTLGAPSREGRMGRDRVVTWVVEWKPLTRYVGVMLDSKGTVVDLYWNLPSEVPWMPKNKCS